MLDEFKEMLEERDRKTLPSVLLVSSECAPLSKTGGLADVIGTLPKSLRKLGMDARVITPYHRIIKNKYSDKVEHLFHFYVNLGWRHEYAGIEKLELNGTVIYLVDSEAFFGDAIYRGGYSEIEQYAFFQRAVLDALPNLDFEPEIVHCNDWQSGMIPMLARTQYRGCMQESRKYLLSIHNIMYQGVWDFASFKDLFGIDDAYFTPEFIELNKAANMMKAGCVFADRISTVSPTYAEEIKTPEYSEGLEGILNARSAQLNGILNGIDTDVFNPAKNSAIAANYSKNDLSKKAECKKSLQQKLGLNVDDSVPILSMVTRMTEQKGFELVMTILDDLMQKENVQFVLLGSGDSRYESFMREAEQRWKGRLCAYIGYNEELAHHVYSGSDYFLMPSRFEPCGLGQMIAMRYGALPIVRETGGLKDSVTPYNCETGEGNGFSFANYDAWEMRNIISYALSFWGNKAVIKKLRIAAMKRDFSFESSAKEYVKLYISMLDGFHETLPVISHDCSNLNFRQPFGAVKCGEQVTISADLISGRAKELLLVLYDGGESIEFPMKKSSEKYSAQFNAPERAAAWHYYFRVETKYGTRYLCPDSSGLKAALFDSPVGGFQLTVYLPDFQAPEWFKKSVMYQIFPDRFGFSSRAAVSKGIKAHKEKGWKAELHKNIDEPVKWQAENDEKDYIPNDFYGGTINGIIKKLDYLKELGISCIYLNPVFESSSNHRYNTSDYLKIDPILGSEEDFKNLCRKASEKGIRIVLDGVFSHTGKESEYFKKACEDKDSSFYSWYSFKEYPDDYKCWWNFKDLPEVDERNENWQDFVIKGENSVIKSWLKKGASGWRLDVADEIPDDVLQLIRKSIKEEDPDNVIVGEVWEDATTKTGPEGPRNYALGYSLDSVMNYPLRWAVLDFLHFRSDANELRNFFIKQKMNYPTPIYYSLMNLLASHDVDRILTALSTPVTLRNLSREEQLEVKITKEDEKRALKLEKLAAVIQFAIPGVPCIYYGDEQGLTGLCDPFNRGPFMEKNADLHKFYSKLAKKRNNSEALQNGEVEFFALSGDVLAILRFCGKGKKVLALVNRGNEPFEYNISGISKGKINALSAKMIEV